MYTPLSSAKTPIRPERDVEIVKMNPSVSMTAKKDSYALVAENAKYFPKNPPSKNVNSYSSNISMNPKPLSVLNISSPPFAKLTARSDPSWFS